VPFGAWDMPINFEVQPDGGSCAPGCHDPRSYNRVQAIEPTPTIERELPVETLVEAPSETPVAPSSENSGV